jgi:hypothetical protein
MNRDRGRGWGRDWLGDGDLGAARGASERGVWNLDLDLGVL